MTPTLTTLADTRPGLVPVTATLIGTIALQTAVPPFATDMWLFTEVSGFGV